MSLIWQIGGPTTDVKLKILLENDYNKEVARNIMGG